MTIPFPAFLKGGGERTDVDKTWVDSILPVKTTDNQIWRYITRDKTGALIEGWAVQQDSRAVDKTWSDSVLPVKTTNNDAVNYPADLVATFDDNSCPGPTVTVDLTWDVGGDTSNTMTLQRRTSSVWYDVDTNISAGQESYSDTNATEEFTDKYRIKFNYSGSAYTESNDVDTLCPT